MGCERLCDDGRRDFGLRDRVSEVLCKMGLTLYLTVLQDTTFHFGCAYESAFRRPSRAAGALQGSIRCHRQFSQAPQSTQSVQPSYKGCPYNSQSKT